MTDRVSPCTITATDAAVRALDTLRAEHGPLILHITAGGDDSGTPICLPANELRIGPRDVLLGSVHGVEVLEMATRTDGHFRTGSFVVDVVKGVPVGFSLTPGDHVRFAIRQSDPSGA